MELTKDELLKLYPWPKNSLNKELQLIENFQSIELQSEAQTIWSWLSDSSRINRALGMSHRDEKEVDGKLHVSTKMLGLEQEWIERSWNWDFGKSIIVDREYLKGFGKFNHSIFYFHNKKLYVYMGFTSKGLLSNTLLRAGVPKVVGQLLNLIKEMDKELHAGALIPSYFKESSRKLESAPLKRLEERLSKAQKDGAPKEHLKKFFDLITTEDELDLYKLRPVELARKWEESPSEILNSFLIATYHKVFEISWDIICPSCLGERTKAKDLIDLLEVDHCESCKINFQTNGENSIEISFQIHPDIREVPKQQFCAAEPARKKHIKLQWNIQELDESQVFSLESGRYRMRILGHDYLKFLKVSEAENKALDLDSELHEINLSHDFNIRKGQKFKDGRLIIEVELTDPNTLRPKDIFSKNIFKKFFKEQSLNKGVQLYLGEQVIVFTDIVASTKFYQDVGDKEAYREISPHFEAIEEIFEACDGVIIKTIGDAVMASFPNPRKAVLACEKMHRHFNPQRTEFPFELRASAHIGKVIGVNRNTGIDYFGNTVNYAAKLQANAEAQELAISQEFKDQLKDNDLTNWKVTKGTYHLAAEVRARDTYTLRLSHD